jgi:hypothetical protein
MFKTKKNNCLFRLLVLAVIAGVVAAILTLGILMLSVWKCVALRKEKLEFMKFKNEQEKSQWGVVSTFRFIYFIHAHACIFITLMRTCTQNLYVAFCIRTVI